MMEDYKDIYLEELADKEHLTVRAVNICEKFGLLSLNLIMNFYLKNGSFMILQNCGIKTEKELIALCEKYKEIKITTECKRDFLIINELNPIKRSALNRHAEYLISNLSIRARNGIKNISTSEGTKEILQTIYAPDFQFKNLKNIGIKTVEELNAFKSKTSSFINQLRVLPNEEIGKEYAKLVVKATFKEPPDNFEEEFERVLDTSGKIKLFRLIGLLIESDQLFSGNDKRIFTGIYLTEDGKEESLSSIGADLNLSVERIRQLKSLLQEDMQNRLLFISNFIADDFVKYDVETSSPIKTIDDSFSRKIRINEEVNFNTLLCSIILGVFYGKSHSVLGDDEAIIGKRKTKGKKRFKCCYIIRRNLFDIFNFELFVENIHALLSEKTNETYSLHFEGYLSQFIKGDSRYILGEITCVCKTIILSEFDLVVNFEGYLVFERNTKKALSEYALEILESKGNIMKVEDILDAISEKYPELVITENSLRIKLQREKNIFISFGRSSTYGLKAWEAQQDDIKGGTIRDIVEEYLQNANEPKHISDIFKYVQKYRSTNEKNVMSNIEAEDSKRFQFFQGDFVGLNSKTYEPKSTKYKRIIGSHFIKKKLAKYNGIDIAEVIEHYVVSYGYAPIQVRYILEKKILEGVIQITSENKLIV